MNILFYRYGSICEPDIIDAFKEYGTNITEDTTEIFDKNITPSERVQIVSKVITSGNYIFVFSINFFPEVSQVCEIYHIPYMCLIVDSPVLTLFSDALKNSYNRIFIFDRELYNEFHPVNPDCIFHIPLATNVARWDKVLANPSQDYYSKISFVGSLYTEKCFYDQITINSEYDKGYLEAVMNAQKLVYGYNFIEAVLNDKLVDIFSSQFKNFDIQMYDDMAVKKNITAHFFIDTKITTLERQELLQLLSEKLPVNVYTGSDTSALKNINNCGRVKTHTQMPLVFHNSDINLNFTTRSIRSGIPLRVFDIMGCQGFVLSNYQSELTDYFNIGEHIECFDSAECLLDKIYYYLNHPTLRKEIAHNGYEEVKLHHTYTIRIGQMIEMAFGNRGDN